MSVNLNKYRNRLIKDYPGVDPVILRQYKPAEKKIIFNDNDPDLQPIKVKLPEEPKDLSRVDGFGLPAKDQKWKRPGIPKRLVDLEKRFNTIDEIWEELDVNQKNYREEIKFIKRMWYYRLNGYWFYNNGVPTYIDGFHFFYCGFWPIDTGFPKYRYRDRLFFIFARFCYTDTHAYYNYRIHLKDDKYRYFSKIEDAELYLKSKLKGEGKVQQGEYLVDMGRRVCYGFNYPKFRQEGATNKAGLLNYEIISRTIRGHGHIMSKSEGHAQKEVFQKVVAAPFRKLIWFFKPNFDGSTNPKNELLLDIPATKIGNKGSIVNIDVGLEAMINYGVSDGSDADGATLHFHHHDEVGKFKAPLNVYHIHNIVRSACSTGAGSQIRALMLKTSTVGEMDKGGGNHFFTLCKHSNYAMRDANGQTTSGLYNLFIPTEIGLPGFIDEYGNPVVDTPEHPITGEDGKPILIGAREFIENKISNYIANDDWEGLAETRRQFPQRFAHCFRSNNKGTGFNMEKIESRLDILKFHNPTKVRGDFYWVNNKFGGRVEFRPDINGKFFLSTRLPKSISNNRYIDSEGIHFPLNDKKFVAGGDPYNYNVTNQEQKKSNGGGAVFMRHDPTIDTGDDPSTWIQSYRFVCTYSNRVFDKDEYCEDMLMMCIYFGCKISPENNPSPIIWDYFVRHGYSGYLFYHVDRKTGVAKATPGVTLANNEFKTQLFIETDTYIDKHVHKEVHDELIEEWRDISSFDDLKKFDLMAAAGHALVAANSMYNFYREEKEETEESSIDDYVSTFSF